MKKILIVVIMIIALLAVEVILVKSAANYEPMVEVIYTKTKIAEKTVITEDMLTRKKINFSLVHSQSIKSEADIVGKKALIDIEANEMLLQSKIGQVIEMENIQLSDNNNRLFSIEFKPDQVNGWWLKVGQRVDIICVPNDLKDIKQDSIINKHREAPTAPNQISTETEVPGENQQAQQQTKTNNGIIKIENIRIAAIFDEGGKLLKNEQRTSVPRIISFELEPGLDEYLAWAKGNARIEISARTDSEDKQY